MQLPDKPDSDIALAEATQQFFDVVQHEALRETPHGEGELDIMRQKDLRRWYRLQYSHRHGLLGLEPLP